jgi:RNA polymerase subunit RPABC4/transcription elongation factor Spt4
VKLKDPVAIEVDPSRLGESQNDVLKCLKCQTLLYDNTGTHCMVCGTPCMTEGFKPRPFPQSSLPKVKPEDNPSSSGVWKCVSCTLLNDPDQTICQACGSKKGDRDKPIEKLPRSG